MYLCGGSSQLEQQILQVKMTFFIEKKIMIKKKSLGNTIIRKFW